MKTTPTQAKDSEIKVNTSKSQPKFIARFSRKLPFVHYIFKALHALFSLVLNSNSLARSTLFTGSKMVTNYQESNSNLAPEEEESVNSILKKVPSGAVEKLNTAERVAIYDEIKQVVNNKTITFSSPDKVFDEVTKKTANAIATILMNSNANSAMDGTSDIEFILQGSLLQEISDQEINKQ